MRRLSHHFSYRKFASFFQFSSFSKSAKLSLAYLVLLAGLSAVFGTAAAASIEEDAGIPKDAIRIRILANSDSEYDQQVKRDVRDRVEAVIRSWGAMPGTHDEARALIASHLDDIQDTADRALSEWGTPYGAKVELGSVPFPVKMFEERSYEAGDYEALRISLGGGEGANWWCVLFPPLCLTAATAPDPDAEAAKKTAAVSAKAGGAQKTAAKSASKAPAKTVAKKADTQADGGEKPEPRFFLWELLQKFGDFLKSIFG